MVCKLRVLLRTDPLGQPGSPCWDYTARLGITGDVQPSAATGRPDSPGLRSWSHRESRDSNPNPPKSPRFRVDYFRQTQ